ncbi:hypothetical protein ACLESO_48445 [Pyxidicoccus sp. 3LG]
MATGGAEGVQRVLDGLREDTAHAFALAGVPSVSAVGADLVAPVHRR